MAKWFSTRTVNISTTFCNVLCGAGRLGGGEAPGVRELREGWRGGSLQYEMIIQTVVHNDVTPAEVVFGDGPWQSLERMKLADRVLNRAGCGELQYYFLRHAGDRWLAGPFIGHFLWELLAHFPNSDAALPLNHPPCPFYAGLTLLRIAPQLMACPSLQPATDG